MRQKPQRRVLGLRDHSPAQSCYGSIGLDMTMTALLAPPRARALTLADNVTDDMLQKERLAYAIRYAMQKKRLSAPEVAARIGRSTITVGRWVRGETAPSLLDVGPLANALGVRPEYLFDPPEIPEYPIEQYLVEDAVLGGVEEGERRADRRRGERQAR